MSTQKPLTKEQKIIRKLSDKIVRAQRPIRILEAIKWGDDIKHAFFQQKAQKLPKVTAAYYQKQKIRYDPLAKIAEFEQVNQEIRAKLGTFNGASRMMQRMCADYIAAMKMLLARGTPDFNLYSNQLYGSTRDALYAGAPKLRDVAQNIANMLENISLQDIQNENDEKKYTARQAAAIMQRNLRQYFHDHSNLIKVQASSDIIADAAAGAEQIKMNTKIKFSNRNIRQLEVHEGWVHLGTTLNGKAQPICTFLSKGAPSSTVTQEGLAILVEILTMSSYPSRIRRINNRVIAIDMAEEGADFIEVYQFFRKTARMGEDEAFNATARVFRGSTATHKPFTKDLSYTKGFISIYNYLRLAFQHGLLSHIPLLFVGKCALEDLRIIVDLVEEGLVTLPKYVPPQFSDPAPLAAWASYSNSLVGLDLKKIEFDFRSLLRE